MKLDDFDFHLPEALIATRPASPRPSAKLLYAQGDQITDAQVYDLEHILRAGDMLVLNNTRVIPAQLAGARLRGDLAAKVDVTLMAPDTAGNWRAMARPLRKLALGDRITFDAGLTAEVIAKTQEDCHLRFNLSGADFDAALAGAGQMPLPPYIAAKRPTDARDLDDYQTVFARHAGAVAAPTASLHFDRPLLERLAAKGVQFTEVTLHVGAGTFLPVKVEDVTTHKMHAEWGEVTPQAAAAINAARAAGGRIIPVGTTALRLIETAARGGHLRPWVGDTDIFIYPGFQFHITDGLMTNFHLPKSTLLMLVSALMGKARMDRIYAHAIAQNYRFFSYGDASLLLRS
ncbi:MAG: tRNA preQ1(34) S-adenosylmethionine ribosyltransferase-isomerase QueA [Cypionkella sp.]|nr:tRNA preQ1(34) S-adenosylmethionine ribosyltransferase-isomerase QueA [Cypionkella sp.]